MAGNSYGGTTIGTNYRGNRAAAPPNWSFEERNPTQYDSINYVIGDLWLNIATRQVWVLVSLQGTTTSKGELADWREWGGGGDLDSLTGDVGGVVFGDANRNINTLGTAGEILVTGNPGTNTLTWSLAQPPSGSVGFAASISASIPNATGVNVFLIPFDTLVWDINSGFDTTTGTFTAPHQGLYAFQSTVAVIILTVTEQVIIVGFEVAGTGPCVGQPGTFIRCNPYACSDGVSGVYRVNGSTTLFLNAGDTVNVRVQVFGGGVGDTVTIYRGGGAPYNGTWFTGYNIS